ncbi:hypothetical protein M5E89_08845 [Acidaminococcus intestini]|nr:hypothetical protein M5E89_08845 [Acidaminococcus intestini]
MTIRTMIRCWFGDTLRLGASLLTSCRHLQRPAHQARSFFQPMDLYAAICVVAHDLDRLDVHKSYAVVDEAGCS